MAEVMAEARYAGHHKKKLVLVFSAIRHLAENLRREGWQVDYVKLEDAGNTQSLKGEVERAQTRRSISNVMMTEPGEWRLRQELAHIEPFWFAVTAEQSEQALDYFLTHVLPHFGETQDAMLIDQKFLHHAVLSPYINLGLLDPLRVCRRVEQEYKKGRVALASAEGFIRQIIGWREYIRGIYWLKMPDYADGNALNATRNLPAFYWTGETDMNCIAHTVKQTREVAYTHHIQRLMITGNFTLIGGLDPRQVHEWYLAVYADAYEWVELPNTIGMSLHADDGLLESKPYASSGNYINKMSDYCKSCRYDVKQRTGPEACPFNALYWDFIARHHARFSKNPRMANITQVYEKFDEEEKVRIAESAEGFLGGVESWV